MATLLASLAGLLLAGASSSHATVSTSTASFS